MSTQPSRRSLDNRPALETMSNKRNKKPSEFLDNSSKPGHQYNTRSSGPLSEISCSQCRANSEYIKVVQEALKEVLDQNEALRSRVAELEAIISQSEDDIDEKNRMIQQLEQAFNQLANDSKGEQKKKISGK